jgi:hypothetical protein
MIIMTRKMRHIVVLGAVVALLLGLTPAQAATPATRAQIVASIGDAFGDLAGATPAQVHAAATDARAALGADLFGDVDGVDLDVDGDVDDRDTHIADLIAIAQHEGWIEGYGDGQFGSHDTLRRAPTASIYASVLGVDVRTPTGAVLYKDVTDENIHGCNIHTLSDLDRDGRYYWDHRPEEWTDPFVINGYVPRTIDREQLEFPDLFGPWDNVTIRQVDLMTDRAVRSATLYTDADFYPYESLCPDTNGDGDRTAVEVFTEIAARDA